MPLLPPRRKRASQPKPWLNRADQKTVKAWRERYPRDVAAIVFIKTGDWRSLQCDYHQRKLGQLSFSLQRKVQYPRQDWSQLVRLACWVANYDEARCRAVLGAIATCRPTSTCTLTITPEGFALKDLVGKQLVTLVEGTF